MQIKIIGCGEAFDSYGFGNNSCVLYGRSLPTVLFDCGYQIPERLWQYPKIYKNLNAIYFTHTHADHIFGIVPLLARYLEEGRRKTLVIFGPKGIKKHALALLKLGYSSVAKKLTFKIVFKELKSGQSFRYENLMFSCARSAHSRVNLSVRVQAKNGKSFGVSGDGNLTPATKKLFSGVDLLLHECFWLKQRENFHSSLETIYEFAISHGVKKVGLTHQSRLLRGRIEGAVARLGDRRFFVVKPGQIIKF